MVDDYMLNKVLHKMKEVIGIEQFDNLIDTIDKLADDILMTCVIKDNSRFYKQLFLLTIFLLMKIGIKFQPK